MVHRDFLEARTMRRRKYIWSVHLDLSVPVNAQKLKLEKEMTQNARFPRFSF